MHQSHDYKKRALNKDSVDIGNEDIIEDTPIIEIN
jgi:hypothetical protein